MLTNKVIIVTGAGSGLGEETATQLADYGATVIACDLGTEHDGSGSDDQTVRETVEVIRSAGGEAKASFGDVTDKKYIADLVEETVDEYGKIDGVVNYAGILRDSMSFNMSLEDWETVVDVHLKGHFNLLHELGNLWRNRYKEELIDSQRSFLAVSSASSRGSVGQVNYSAAKAGILGLTRTGARELHQYNVRVNAMLPAAVTPLMRHGVPDDVLEQINESDVGTEKVAPLPVVLMADNAEDITGWTFAIGGDTVYTVTDPEFERLAIKDGGWDAETLTGAIDELLSDRPRSKTSPGGLLGRVGK